MSKIRTRDTNTFAQKSHIIRVVESGFEPISKVMSYPTWESYVLVLKSVLKGKTEETQKCP